MYDLFLGVLCNGSIHVYFKGDLLLQAHFAIAQTWPVLCVTNRFMLILYNYFQLQYY